MGPSDDPVKFVDGSRAVRESCQGPRAFRASLVKLMNVQNLLVLRLSESGTQPTCFTRLVRHAPIPIHDSDDEDDAPT